MFTSAVPGGQVVHCEDTRRRTTSVLTFSVAEWIFLKTEQATLLIDPARPLGLGNICTAA